MIAYCPIVYAARPLPATPKPRREGKGCFKYRSKFEHDVFLKTIKGYRVIVPNEYFYATDAHFHFVQQNLLEIIKE